MAGYYVLGVALVVFALTLTAIGIRSKGFPPTKGVARMLMAFAGVLAVSTFATLLGTTKREHPREEAAEKAANKRAEAAGKRVQETTGGRVVQVVESEYSVRLSGGPSVNAGKITFDLTNEGKIEHDLAVERKGGQAAKTALIAPGKRTRLRVRLRRGTYKLYCTVPGHEQLGMKAEVTVR
jgi:uncharacterized cupredoxin-like copper-binding protein